MRFIPTAKAKPKFDQLYLVTDGKEADLAYLESSTNTKGVMLHRFNSGVVASPTYIAAVELPAPVAATPPPIVAPGQAA